jgi:hypothetical protein
MFLPTKSLMLKAAEMTAAAAAALVRSASTPGMWRHACRPLCCACHQVLQQMRSLRCGVLALFGLQCCHMQICVVTVVTIDCRVCNDTISAKGHKIMGLWIVVQGCQKPAGQLHYTTHL